MATNKPRITITLNPSTYRVLKSISDLGGKPMSAFVAEMLDSAMPTLERMAVTYRAIKEAQDAHRDKFLVSLDRAQAVLEPAVSEVIGQFDLFLQTIETAAADEGHREEATPAAAADPRPVTRGSTPLKRKKSAASTATTKASTRAALGRKS